MKIYTRTGDEGKTSTFSGERVLKSDSAIEAYGTVDELNSVLGFARAACADENLSEQLLQIQHDLHSLCSDLATLSDSKKTVERFDAKRAKSLERWIDQHEEKLQPLKEFILAGGTELASRLHFARTVARRAEREVIRHSGQHSVNPQIVIYLNRLSDLLFVMARVANKNQSVADIPWDKSR